MIYHVTDQSHVIFSLIQFNVEVDEKCTFSIEKLPWSL